MYRTNKRTIAPNASYFKPIILIFKALIYNNNSEIVYTFYVCGDNIPFRKGILLEVGIF